MIGPSDRDPIYRRTKKGEEAVLSLAKYLSDDARHVLLLVNGLTPLSDLAPFTPNGISPTVVEKLCLADLIEPCARDVATH